MRAVGGGSDTATVSSGSDPAIPRREGTSETATEAVGWAVGGGCESGWGRLLSVANAVEVGTWLLAGHRVV